MKQIQQVRKSPELEWVTEFNFNSLSGTSLYDPVESNEPLNTEMNKLFDKLCWNVGRNYTLGSTEFWMQIVTASTERAAQDRILLDDHRLLEKYLTEDGRPTELLKRKIVLNHREPKSSGIFYNRWGYCVPFNILQIDHKRFRLECQNCNEDYLYCFCPVGQRVQYPPLVSMRQIDGSSARQKFSDHNKHPMNTGKQEESCSPVPQMILRSGLRRKRSTRPEITNMFRRSSPSNDESTLSNKYKITEDSETKTKNFLKTISSTHEMMCWNR